MTSDPDIEKHPRIMQALLIKAAQIHKGVPEEVETEMVPVEPLAKRARLTMGSMSMVDPRAGYVAGA